MSRKVQGREVRFQVRHAIIDGVYVVEADTTFAYGRHIHDEFGIGLIHRGAQVSLSGRGMVEAEAGNLITVNPGEVHDGAPVGDRGRAWKMLYFEPRIVTELFHDMTEGRTGFYELCNPVVRDRCAAEHFHSLFEAMITCAGSAQKMEAEERLFLMLEMLLESREKTEDAHSVSQTIAIAKARIDDEPAASLSLYDLAQLCGMSRFQVLRQFARATGLTPHAYMIQRRLQMSKKMILEGYDLSDAAACCGFADQSHMTRLFVRSFGMSPSYYATLRRQSAPAISFKTK